MKVKLISKTENPIDVMWTAARTCYSEKSPIEIWENDVIRNKAINQQLPAGINSKEYIEFKESANKHEEEISEKHWNLVKKVLDSGHQSIAEHVYFTFAIEGISRACSHQLVRHRAGIVFSQQSQRYVEIKEDISNILRWEEAKPLLDKYFTDVNTNNWQEYLDCLKHYLHHIQMGMKSEDARAILPNATKTNITMSLNYRELIHICNLRLCSRAQKEIRTLFTQIVEQIKQIEPKLVQYLVPQCEVTGMCQELTCCGRKPKMSNVLQGYENYVKNRKEELES